MSKEPVNQSQPNNGEDADGDTRVLNIESLHYHPTEIDSLNRLAQTDPELARIVVQQKDSFDRREHGSYRFGVFMSLVLVAFLLISLSYIFINLGIVLSLALIFCIFVVALLIRVLLTGEWSETSWAGHLINGIVTILGGKPKG